MLHTVTVVLSVCYWHNKLVQSLYILLILLRFSYNEETSTLALRILCILAAEQWRECVCLVWFQISTVFLRNRLFNP